LRFEAASKRSSLAQLLPPLALFLPLLARTGTMLVLGCALAVAAIAYSVGRLAWLAWRRPPPGTRRLRAVLTIVFAVAMLGVAWMQVAPTYHYAATLARSLQQQCTNLGKCPTRIATWDDAPGPRGSDAQIGARVRYPLAYRSDGPTFRLCWVVAFGRCRSASGGAQVAFEPMRPWPWPGIGAGKP
jgi:hypothetical protein